MNSVSGSSKLVTPNEPPVGPVFRPQSTPAWVKSPSPTGRKDEKNTEVEAERLWWSDACERQVKELQSAFGTEFSRLAERLTRDIAGCEQKLEQLVENESKMRAHALAEIRREADSQGTELSELIRSHQDVKDQVTSLQASLWLRPGAEADFDKLQKEVKETRDLVLSLQSRPVLEIPSEHSPQNLKVQQLEATLTDIRRDLVGCVDAQEQVEKLIQSLQRDCSEVQEKVRLQSAASEEQRSLHQVISQSAGDLGKGIEEVSAAMLQAESNLRQEIQKNDREIRAEVVEEVEARFKQFAQSLTDERESRLRESGILKTRIDTAYSRLDQLEPSGTSQEMSSIKMSLEETRTEQTQLQTALGLLEAECRRTAAASPTANQETGIQQVSDAALRLRVEALEAQADSQVPRSLQLESQVKELRATMVPVGNRVQALEAELRKWDWDTTTARLNAAEAEITRLGRDNGIAEGLRSDVEVLKRKLAREPTAAERLPRLVGRSLIPEDLRNRVGLLVKNVHDTVTQPLAGDIEGTVASDSTVSAPSAEARSGEADMEQQLAQLLQLHGDEDISKNTQLIAAIQALREKNSELREKNAELLAQEGFVPDGAQLPRQTWQPGETLKTYRSGTVDPVAVVQGGTLQLPPHREALAGSVLAAPGGGAGQYVASGTVPGAGMAVHGSMMLPRGSAAIPLYPGGPRTNSPRRDRSKESTGGVVRSLTPLARFKEQGQHLRGSSPERRPDVGRSTVVVAGVPPGMVPVAGWIPKQS